MFKTDHKKAPATAFAGQAATELAVFGAVLIFLLGTIIRSSVGNGMTENKNFNAMRMAMLSSWVDSKTSNPSHNNPSLLIVEDRLSPDFNKYGDMDRNPYITEGSGAFTYYMFYPVEESEVNGYLPIMDVWINGQHFPFTTASFVQGRTLTYPEACGSGGPYENYPLTQAQCLQNQCLRSNREWIAGPPGIPGHYKLFYSLVANGNAYFSVMPPACRGTGLNTTPYDINCKDLALSSTVVLPDENGNPFKNTNGEMEFDLLRNGDYAAVDQQFPAIANCASPAGVPTTNMMRCNVSWQWSATVAGYASNNVLVYSKGAQTNPYIGLNSTNDEFPSYDIDGRLKPVTIYGMSVDRTTGFPTLDYEDFQGGDIDTTWDANTCNVKPGLQPDSQIFSFTQNGTYLQIKEGKLYNPQTGQVVSSVNKRNTIDVIQRTIQLSNNTGRFCKGNVPVAPYVGSGTLTPTADANPVETCSSNCFGSDTIATTCYDTNTNVIYARSRIQNLGGRSWLTDASGQLKVQ